MLTMMKNCLVLTKQSKEDEGEDGVKVDMEKNENLKSKKTIIQDLIDLTIRKMDHDRDGRISFLDFSATVSKEPLMMEAFGNCLPSNRAGVEFMARVLDSRPNTILYHA